MTMWTMGLNPRTKGVWANNLCHNLHLVTGKIGVPGSTPFSITGQPTRGENIVVLKHAEQKAGLVVDTLLGEFQTVIKPLGQMFSQVKCISGSTILGSGDVALILDVPALVRQAGDALAVMAGGGVRAPNVTALVLATGVREVHAQLLGRQASPADGAASLAVIDTVAVSLSAMVNIAVAGVPGRAAGSLVLRI